MRIAPVTQLSVALVAAAACHDRAAPTPSGSQLTRPQPAPPLPQSPVQAVGACQNVNIDGPCTFTSLYRVRGDDGAPVAPDAPADPGGTVIYSAGYALTEDSGASPAVWVRALPGDRPALERYFAQHPQARCAGVIVRAPCPPGVHVVVDVPPPPVGTVLRQP